ncbi:MAG: deoxyguanosinetriphosphate triphosphohydrolase [Steroidobacteraceae bacterium]
MAVTPDSLAPYASQDATSRGRRYQEPAPSHRSEYQRDRDRIIHSNAFRRLVYKTQVFVNHEGDLYRTRLTHSIEVAQIARTIARALNVNETLTEAICLAHDLGHTAFGHAGQDALNECMRDYGGFEHNLQSLRVVEELEERYAEFPGLNLTFETREGILKHCSLQNARKLGELGERFIRRQQPSLEAQIANVADEIAYNNHDVDDGVRAGLITIEGLREVRLFAREHDEVLRLYPDINGRRVIHEVVRRMVNRVVTDLIETTASSLQSTTPATAEAVRLHSGQIVGFGTEVANEHLELKRYLRDHVYRHYRVLRMTTKARKVIHTLFDILFNTPALLPPEHHLACERLQNEAGDDGKARAIADYIAGMTDRYALAEYKRLVDPSARS